MARIPAEGNFLNSEALNGSGLTVQMLADGVASTYRTLDAVDSTLLDMGNTRLATLVELANLSSMIGNLLGSGIANASNGVFRKNGPHKYPDLLACRLDATDVEIKIALEDNKPKGHLAKSGFYLTCRYVLADTTGNFVRGPVSRGAVAWIWELRAGSLARDHFNLSNTPGDSGKTAVVNALGMQQLQVVYCDLAFSPALEKERFSEGTRLCSCRRVHRYRSSDSARICPSSGGTAFPICFTI